MKTNIIKKLMAAVLAVIMLVGILAIPASAANTVSPEKGTVRFSDVSDDAWYAEAVNAMADAGVVNGYSDGTFRPNSTITLGEAAAVAWRLYGSHICSVDELVKVSSPGISPYFEQYRGIYLDDVDKEGNSWGYVYPVHWAGAVTAQVYAHDSTSWDYIACMVDQPISRGRAISTVVDILTKGGVIDTRLANSASKNMSGTDIPDWNVLSDIRYESNPDGKNVPTNGQYWNYINPWNADTLFVKTGFAGTWRTSYVLKGYQAGVVTGTDASGTCDPTALVTRAQFCQMLYNAGLPDSNMYGKYQSLITFKRDREYYRYNKHDSGIAEKLRPEALEYKLPD